jgi:hypothetical protein
MKLDKDVPQSFRRNERSVVSTVGDMIAELRGSWFAGDATCFWGRMFLGQNKARSKRSNNAARTRHKTIRI